jgi:hypothetical protein
MPLNAKDDQLLKTVYQNIDPLESLKPGDQRYQPVYGTADSEDPIELLHGAIDWEPIASMQMFSGFRGSGKTTELFRLKKKLEEQGYLVLYVNALDYLPIAEPVDITQLLIVLAGAFGESLKEELQLDEIKESYWERFWHYLQNTSLNVTEVGIKTGADIKVVLKEASSFRQRLQDMLSKSINELKRQMDHFIEESVLAIRKRKGADTKIVFLFDSLEQIRGSASNEEAVTRSVEILFANHFEKLKLPYIHCIYTVPPWLQFAAPNLTDIEILPSVRQWQNDPLRSEYSPGWNALRELLKKRCGDDGFTRIFGQSDADGKNPLADQLIAVCGGHFRDLLYLLREALLRSRALPALPLNDQIIKAAISSVRGNFLPISISDAIWLDKIERTRDCSLPSNKAEDVQHLTRLLDTHFVLYLKNGGKWYDIHPLIRDEVAAIVKRHQESNPPESSAA